MTDTPADALTSAMRDGAGSFGARCWGARAQLAGGPAGGPVPLGLRSRDGGGGGGGDGDGGCETLSAARATRREGRWGDKTRHDMTKHILATDTDKHDWSDHMLQGKRWLRSLLVQYSVPMCITYDNITV